MAYIGRDLLRKPAYSNYWKGGGGFKNINDSHIKRKDAENQ
jgi:hypothetical protein